MKDVKPSKYLNLELEYKKAFDKKIFPFIKKHIPKDYRTEPIYYLLENLKINRFRSGLPLIIAKELRIYPDSIVPLAALFELTFTTALAQDDFYDDDVNREGLVATHKKFGVKKTLLACDYVNHKILSLVSCNLIIQEETAAYLMFKINDELSKAYSSVQMEQESKKNLFKIKEDYVKELYLNKTAHGRMLLECCFYFCGANSIDLHMICKYANHLAMAGQLKNDIYDYIKHAKFRGLSDLKQGHITYPMFLLLKKIKAKDQKSFLNLLKGNKHDEIIKLLKKHKIIEKIVDMINNEVEKAKIFLLESKTIPNNLKQILGTWAEGNRHFSVTVKL